MVGFIVLSIDFSLSTIQAINFKNYFVEIENFKSKVQNLAQVQNI